jgi:hypothetical protein
MNAFVHPTVLRPAPSGPQKTANGRFDAVLGGLRFSSHFQPIYSLTTFSQSTV